MQPGKFDTRLAILRRGLVAGERTGAFFEVFSTWCAQTRQTAPRPMVEGGLASDVLDITVRVRDCAQNRTISNADRVTLQGADFAVVNTGLPDRLYQTIELTLRRQIAG